LGCAWMATRVDLAVLAVSVGVGAALVVAPSVRRPYAAIVFGAAVLIGASRLRSRLGGRSSAVSEDTPSVSEDTTPHAPADRMSQFQVETPEVKVIPIKKSDSPKKIYRPDPREIKDGTFESAHISNRQQAKVEFSAFGTDKPLPLDVIFAILGEERIGNLCTLFYDRVYSDTENEEFRDQFIESAPQVLAEFSLKGYFIQQFGGPRLWGGMHKDDELVLNIHKHFVIRESFLQIWMDHMKIALPAALADLPEPLSNRVQETLLEFFDSFGKKTINASG